MSKPVLTLVVWSAVALMGASCATQPGADGNTTETPIGPRDFSGIWQASSSNLDLHLLPGEEIALTPYGAERYRIVDHSQFPGNTCLPYGPNRGMSARYPYMIVQTSEVIAVLTEHVDYRIFYMDGRDHPDDIMDYPERMGHSIGRWENDTRVVVAIRKANSCSKS